MARAAKRFWAFLLRTDTRAVVAAILSLDYHQAKTWMTRSTSASLLENPEGGCFFTSGPGASCRQTSTQKYRSNVSVSEDEASEEEGVLKEGTEEEHLNSRSVYNSTIPASRQPYIGIVNMLSTSKFKLKFQPIPNTLEDLYAFGSYDDDIEECRAKGSLLSCDNNKYCLWWLLLLESYT
ncbi:hypothetical protein EV361DRAFT_870998 [Lentinula raphanica]|nr:hypothetical protein EV361DRAFT_870998 [Lentinula raphanica]